MSTVPHHPALAHLGVTVAVGALTAAALALTGHAGLAPVGGWVAGGAVYVLLAWLTIRGMDGVQTEQHSQVEDGGRTATDLALLLASVASLAGVGFLLAGGSSKDAGGVVEGLLGLAAVFTSWFTVHMVWSLRYARLYYGDGNRGIDFPQESQPDYQDFVYLGYCLGMTYQVSDTDITDRTIRRAVTRHTLLSYLLGAVVVGCSINLVVQLAG